jgi:hypothetical protein
METPMLNGLTQERHDALLDQLRGYVAEHADDLPKADAAYRELYGDQIDLFTFRQVWRRACIEHTEAAERAPEQEAPQDDAAAEVQDAPQSPAGDLQDVEQEPADDLPADS